MSAASGQRRVVVTGATGCIGRHAVPALVAGGWEVHAVSSRPQDEAATPGVRWHAADLLQPQAAADLAKACGASHLLHLAWYIAPGKWAAARENYWWVEASLRLIRAFHEAGGQRVVVAGSCLEYDWRYGFCHEQLTPREPHTFYGTCKHSVQRLLDGYASVVNLSWAWARIFFLYGPWEHTERLVAAVSRALVVGEPARTSHGRQVRDYLHAADVAEALVTLLASDLTGTINVASGEAVTLKHIIERLGAIAGRPELLHIGAIPPAPTDTALVVANVARLTNELQWRPRIGLDEGLASTLEWWRRQLRQETQGARR